MGYIYQLEVYTKMVKVDLRIQFKISVMKRKFENQKHKAQVSNFVNNFNVCTKVWLGLEWRGEEEWLSPNHTRDEG